MSVLPFPPRRPTRRRRTKPFHVEVMREALGGWFVICTARGHGWLHGSRREAVADARKIADGWGVGIVVRLT